MPSFDTIAVKYLKLDTTPSGSPSVETLALVLIVLFTITFDLLSTIPYTPDLSTSLLVRFLRLTATARLDVIIVCETKVTDRSTTGRGGSVGGGGSGRVSPAWLSPERVSE